MRPKISTALGKHCVIYCISWFLLSCCSLCFAISPPKKTLPLYWWEPWDGSHNFGDVLSHALVQKMLPGYDVQQPSPSQKKLLAIGSIIHLAQEGDIIWGSGINGKHPATTDYHFRSLDVRAVRGPLTRNFLLGMGIACPEIYGDPALLLPLFFHEFKKNPIREYIVIPHISEMLLFHDDPNVVLPTEDWKVVVQKIVESKFVISSSLHGIIIAEAFQIPARLLKITNNEPLFKYEDYYLGTGRTSFTYAKSVAEALNMGGEKPAHINRMALLQAFPHDMLPLISQDKRSP